MPIPKGKVYTNPHGGEISEYETTGLTITYLGQTKDGFDVSHFTFYRNGRHMSYDAVRMNGEYYYVLGSGHETDERGNIAQWDHGNQIRGNDALRKNALELIKDY